jgi:hypothetical protein
LFDDREGALADGAGGTENRETFQGGFFFLVLPLSLDRGMGPAD